jgi:hypothetical protein
MYRKALIASIFFAILIIPHNECFAVGGRHFTYTYESEVEEKGGREIEIWNTLRLNRKNFYRGIDTRSEYELALTKNLQTSIYLDVSNASSEENGSIVREQSFGFSNEWIYRMLDRDVDPPSELLSMQSRA